MSGYLREKNYYYSPCYCYPTTCPLLKKDSSNSCGRKTGTPTDEEDEVKILNLDSRCPARAALPWAVIRKKEQKAQAREE